MKVFRGAWPPPPSTQVTFGPVTLERTISFRGRCNLETVGAYASKWNEDIRGHLHGERGDDFQKSRQEEVTLCARLPSHGLPRELPIRYAVVRGIQNADPPPRRETHRVASGSVELPSSLRQQNTIAGLHADPVSYIRNSTINSEKTRVFF